MLASDTYGSDLEHGVPRLAPRSIPATYVWATYMTALLLLPTAVIVIGHRAPQARWLGAGWSGWESEGR